MLIGTPIRLSTKYQIIDLVYITQINNQQLKSILRQFINYQQIIYGQNHKIPCTKENITKLQQELSKFVKNYNYNVLINESIYIIPTNDNINLLHDWMDD